MICPSCFGLRWVATMWNYALRSLGRLNHRQGPRPPKQLAELPREREPVDVLLLVLALIAGLARPAGRADPLSPTPALLHGSLIGVSFGASVGSCSQPLTHVVLWFRRLHPRIGPRARAGRRRRGSAWGSRNRANASGCGSAVWGPSFAGMTAAPTRESGRELVESLTVGSARR